MPHPSSYRDPSGFIFLKDGIVYRQVNLSFRDQYEKFMQSGCYDHFVSEGWMIPHTRIDRHLSGVGNWYTTIQPEQIPFISYPYEWSFNMLKDAALLTLRLARESLRYGLILKDASPFNIQFHRGRMVFIDSLSFDLYDEKKPWIAYRQFCECFLAPLLLSHYSRQPVQSMMLTYPGGIPLSLASALLPWRTRLSLHPYLHIHLHARTKSDQQTKRREHFSKKKLENILSSLEIVVRACRVPAAKTAWSDYYPEAGSRDDYLESKKSVIGGWLEKLTYRSAADLGANTGAFTELFSEQASPCIAADADPYCMDALYLAQKNTGHRIHPLVIDLSNPSPSIGFNNQERSSFKQRMQGIELVMALALVHHLAIAKNIPLDMLAGFFSSLAHRYLVIEFIPRSDEKVQLLLLNREDIFDRYTQEEFERSFGEHFRLVEKTAISHSGRFLYLFEK
jgi:hypothetical protein